MKKVIAALLTGVMLSVNAAGVFAADTTVSISDVASTKGSSSVTISGKVDNKADDQIITVMTTGITNDAYDTDKMMYIDQKDDITINADGTFTLPFSMSDLAQEGTSYIVRIGGTGISTPASLTFVFGKKDGGGNIPGQIILGDINDDKSVTPNDASILMDFVLNSKDNTITEKGWENAQIEKEEITTFTAKHASMILKRALEGETFKFPKEVQ